MEHTVMHLVGYEFMLQGFRLTSMVQETQWKLLMHKKKPGWYEKRDLKGSHVTILKCFIHLLSCL